MRLSISIFIVCFAVLAAFGQENKPASFIGGESMLDVYLKKHLVASFEDEDLVFEVLVDENGKAHSPTLISPKNQELQLALETLTAQMPTWTPATKENQAIESSVKIECWLEGPVIQDIDHAAQFSGGDRAYFKFLDENLINPVQGQQAKVSVKFVVDKKGKIRHPIIWRGYSEVYNQEALRIANLIPEMIPAEKNGANVNSNYTVTLYFR